ncbi:MAG: glycosyltransferase family 1 protein [Gemmatimonadaceae bacterium]
MIIGLNLLYLLPGIVGGTETYARELISALSRVDSDNHYVLFLNEESSGERFSSISRFEHVVCPVAASSRAKRYVWEQLHLPAFTESYGVDVLHSLGYVGPLFTHAAHVVTIHDVNFLQRDVRMSPVRRAMLGAATFSVARTAQRTITMSNFSRDEIVRRLHVSEARVEVTHLAPRKRLDHQYANPTTAVEREYLLAFAGPSPHKNVPRLIEAFASVSDAIPHSLHIIGSLPRGGSVERVVDALAMGSRVQLLGYIGDDAMETELAGATALVFPSLYEGFGLPIVDAQRLGVAVICSTAGSLPEIAGQGAMLFDPRSVCDIASSISRVSKDRSLRERLIRAGRENVERFSWEATAMDTLRIYADAFHAKRSRAT